MRSSVWSLCNAAPSHLTTHAWNPCPRLPLPPPRPCLQFTWLYALVSFFFLAFSCRSLASASTAALDAVFFLAAASAPFFLAASLALTYRCVQGRGGEGFARMFGKAVQDALKRGRWAGQGSGAGAEKGGAGKRGSAWARCEAARWRCSESA